MWLAVALMVSSVPLILYLLGRRDEGKVRRDWELLLTPRGEGVYRRIEARVQAEMQLADLTCDEPFTFRELGSIDEAKHLLDVGYTVIAKFSPNFLKMLAAMATFSRMVSAMAPTAQRWRLRLYIFGRTLALAT